MIHSTLKGLILSSGTIKTSLFLACYDNPNTGQAVAALFKEMGSPRAFLIEYLLANEWKDEFYRQNQTKGVDLISRSGGRNREVKATGSNGIVDLQPSGGKGMNRTPKVEDFFKNCQTCDYVVVDSKFLSTTGDIRYVILSGEALLAARVHKFNKADTTALFQD